MLAKMYSSKSYKRIYYSVISLLLAVMFLFSVFFYARFIKRQKEEINRRAQESIQRIESWMNLHYQEMMRIVLEIDKNGIFSYAQITSKSQQGALLEELMRYVSGNSFLMDMSYESLLDEENIYSSQGRFDKDSFQKYVYTVTDAFDKEAFFLRRSIQTFATIGTDEMIVRQYPRVAMAYVYGLPMMSGNPKRLITFYVDKNTVDGIVKQFLPCDVLDVQFYERDTRVYALYGLKERPADAVTVDCEGNAGQYRYELILDPAVLYEDYKANQLFYFLTLGVMGLVIVLSSWMVALYNYQPLHKLMNKYAMEHNENLDEYALLNELVEDTIEQKRSMQKKLFVSNVVWDQYETGEDLLLDAREAGIAFEYDEFLCCALQYEDAGAGVGLLRYVTEELDTPQTMAICVERDSGKRLIIMINHSGTEQAHQLLENVFAQMQRVHTGMGACVSDPQQLSRSYQQACSALHEAIRREAALWRYEDMPEKTAEHLENPEKEEKARGKTVANTALLDEILACMQEHLSDTGMSLEFIAGECGISASYLVRYFKSCMNMTPMQYVDSLRMEIARRLLTTTTMTLRQIVEQCGYLDESNFVRKFKKIEGVTPMNYRKTNWKEA